MTTLEIERAVAVPEQGNLVRVRDRFWVVESVVGSSLPPDPISLAGSMLDHLVRLVPIDDKGSAEALTVFWETEPGTEVRPQAELPDPAGGLDDADTFGAFFDAARWGAIASADPNAFQSPFRAGIDIEDYQLLPLVDALHMPRVTLLIADDVGLGKTIEAGLIAQELVLRNQAQKILIVCPPSLCGKWQRDMREKFGLGFEVVDTDYVHRLRRERGVGVNPFCSHPRLIVSMEWVKFESQMRWFDEFLPPDPNTYPRPFDLLIVDAAHQIAPSAVDRYARDSLRTKAMRRLAPYLEHRLFLTATPHNCYPESFQAPLEMLDPNDTPVPATHAAMNPVLHEAKGSAWPECGIRSLHTAERTSQPARSQLGYERRALNLRSRPLVDAVWLPSGLAPDLVTDRIASRNDCTGQSIHSDREPHRRPDVCRLMSTALHWSRSDSTRSGQAPTSSISTSPWCCRRFGKQTSS